MSERSLYPAPFDQGLVRNTYQVPHAVYREALRIMRSQVRGKPNRHGLNVADHSQLCADAISWYAHDGHVTTDPFIAFAVQHHAPDSSSEIQAFVRDAFLAAFANKGYAEAFRIASHVAHRLNVVPANSQYDHPERHQGATNSRYPTGLTISRLSPGQTIMVTDRTMGRSEGPYFVNYIYELSGQVRLDLTFCGSHSTRTENAADLGLLPHPADEHDGEHWDYHRLTMLVP